MNITQTFYDSLAPQYDQLFEDWQRTTREQAAMLERLLGAEGFDRTARVLDCACGIGTQAIGLAALGYGVTASDFSAGALAQARVRAAENRVALTLAQADFRALEGVFPAPFDVVICMDNALPHMLTQDDLTRAVRSITGQMAVGGMLVASIRDYDALLAQKPPYSPPYIHQTPQGRRVSFQTWAWHGDRYRLTQYIIRDEETLAVRKFDCEYRAVRRAELTALLKECGCREVRWLFPEETGFYQPIVVARR